MVVIAGILLFGGGTLNAQSVEYDVTVIPPVPGSWNWIVRGINNHGEVVGWAQFSGDPFFLRAWKWSQAGGMELLPAPPGRDALRYGARDLNDSGVVAGDGGGDGGEAWRFQDGVYTLLGTVGSDPLSTAGGINENGDIAGYSGDPSFGRPKHLYRYTDDDGMVSLLSGRGTDINDSRQVTGYKENTFGGGWEAVRIDADGGVLFLGVLPGRNDSFGFGINNAGQVVGTSRRDESSTGFVYTDEAGMRAIPTVSRWNAAVAINSRGHVVGSGTDPGRAFHWAPETGTRTLTSLIDPSLEISVSSARDINDRGQIAAYGTDLAHGGWVQLLLTPIVTGDVDGDGDVDLADLAALLAAYDTCEGDPAYNPEADLDESGCVDLADLATLLANYGTTGR
jgi:probable HAF family extracellular repeat protein